MPKYMFLLRASEMSDSGKPPSTAVIEDMTKYYMALKDADIVRAAEGFISSATESYRLTFPADPEGEIKETKGPFPINEMISGWWIVETKNGEEALEWARKCPIGGKSVESGFGEQVLEIRRIAGADDFGEEYTPEQRAQGERLREWEAAKSQQ